MLGYYLRLALKASSREPGSAALIVFAIALGISVCVTMLTIYRAMSSNPIWWKSDRLYAITMDSWQPAEPFPGVRAGLPPTELTYTDATSLFKSSIPVRKVIMYTVSGLLRSGDSKPLRLSTRITTSDFFAMFEVPFRYGHGWSAQADTSVEPVIVLSHDLNERLFGGRDSVGHTLSWNDRDFRIVGVLAPWLPQPKFYDLNVGKFDEPEAAYLPWGWGKATQSISSGNIYCWRSESVDTFDELAGTDCSWIQMWVELADTNARDRMHALVDTYWADQRKAGRFPRPRNNRMSNVDTWLEDNEVVADDNRILVGLAFAFLGVCLLSTVSLLLTKFLRGAGVAGIRRALGASRPEIVTQHLVHACVLSAVGAFLGLGLSALFLKILRLLYGGDPDAGRGGYQALAHFDPMGIVWTALLAIVAAVVSGLYPAWRVGRLPPAHSLKTQ